MKEIININVLLCEDCDESLTHINNVFNNIVQEGKEVSFNIVSIISTIEYTKSRFSLHYFLVDMKTDEVSHIGDIAFDRETGENTEKEAEVLKSIVENASQTSAVLRVDSFEFPNYGAYELLVYKYEGEETDKAIELARTKNAHDLRKKENLVTTYEFMVKEKV